MTADRTEAPAEFLRALRSLRAAQPRPHLQLTEIDPPRSVAPFAAALNGEIASAELEDPEQVASGRFVVLHDPAGQPAWEGTYRVVTLVRASLDAEMGGDPLLGEVAWSWLEEAILVSGVRAHALGGTITRVVSESFGALDGRAPESEIEIRASWSPTSSGSLDPRDNAPDLGPHLEAWAGLMLATTGLPTHPSSVTPLPRHRGPRAVARP